MNTQTNTGSAPQPRILFVDDSKLMRVTASRVLGSSFDLVTAEDGSQAWEMLNRDPTIQAVFSDLNMPNMDGYSLLDNIRSANSPRLRELPVVILTSSEEHERARKTAMEQGASDFLGKPFQATELIARARTHASIKETARRIRNLEADSRTDTATGLGNYRFCLDRLDQALSFARRHGHQLSLMHLQMDMLGDANDALASELGDLLVNAAREEDVVCRTAPTILTLLLPATGTRGARQLQDRIEARLEKRGMRARVQIDEPALDPAQRAEPILQQALAALAGDSETMAGSGNQAAPELEEALALLARGQARHVEPHLPELMKRIRPLLDLQERISDHRYPSSAPLYGAETGGS